MPAHALRNVDVDFVMPLSRIPSLLAELTSEVSHEGERVPMPAHVEMEINIAKEDDPRDAGLQRIGRSSPYACPECHCVLLELHEDERIRFRCHTGHAYSAESLLAAINEGIEHAMSTAHRTLEEGSLFMKRMAGQLAQREEREASTRLMEASDRARRRAEAMRELMREEEPVPAADE
jgi:two-component system chemotaxis response regulator CheB